MKVPTRRWGNSDTGKNADGENGPSMKVPTRRWGNRRRGGVHRQRRSPSMKVPTRRWGNRAGKTYGDMVKAPQ